MSSRACLPIRVRVLAVRNADGIGRSRMVADLCGVARWVDDRNRRVCEVRPLVCPVVLPVNDCGEGHRESGVEEVGRIVFEGIGNEVGNRPGRSRSILVDYPEGRPGGREGGCATGTIGATEGDILKEGVEEPAAMSHQVDR